MRSTSSSLRKESNTGKRLRGYKLKDLHQCLEMNRGTMENTGVSPKALEVTGGSILLSRLSVFVLFFLFFLCTRQCLLIAMIITAIHPHCAALFCVTALKASTAAVQRWFDNVHIPSHTGHLGGTTTLNTESQRTKQNTATYSRGHNILYPQKSY